MPASAPPPGRGDGRQQGCQTHFLMSSEGRHEAGPLRTPWRPTENQQLLTSFSGEESSFLVGPLAEQRGWWCWESPPGPLGRSTSSSQPGRPHRAPLPVPMPGGGRGARRPPPQPAPRSASLRQATAEIRPARRIPGPPLDLLSAAPPRSSAFLPPGPEAPRTHLSPGALLAVPAPAILLRPARARGLPTPRTGAVRAGPSGRPPARRSAPCPAWPGLPPRRPRAVIPSFRWSCAGACAALLVRPPLLPACRPPTRLCLAAQRSAAQRSASDGGRCEVGPRAGSSPAPSGSPRRAEPSPKRSQPRCRRALPPPSCGAPGRAGRRELGGGWGLPREAGGGKEGAPLEEGRGGEGGGSTWFNGRQTEISLFGSIKNEAGGARRRRRAGRRRGPRPEPGGAFGQRWARETGGSRRGPGRRKLGAPLASRSAPRRGRGRRKAGAWDGRAEGLLCALPLQGPGARARGSPPPLP